MNPEIVSEENLLKDSSKEEQVLNAPIVPLVISVSENPETDTATENPINLIVQQNATARTSSPSAATTPSPVAQGKILFRSFCLGCHAPPMPNLSLPSFQSFPSLKQEVVKRMITQVTDQKMPMGSNLNERDRGYLIEYLKTSL